MRAEIEPTGISVRRGKVQLRFSFYLEPGDARYGEHHVLITVFPEPDAPLGGYPGEVTTRYDVGLGEIKGTPGMGIFPVYEPVDQADYDSWVDSLPKVWQVNPFHNHMERVSPDVDDVEITNMLKDSLAEFYGMWSRGEDIVRTWKRKGREKPGDMSLENIERCELKGLDIANRATAFEYRERR